MIYLDNAATSINKPQKVIDAVVFAMKNSGNAGRGVNDASLEASRSVYNTRMLINDFFNGEDPAQVAFTSNITESLNIVIKGLFNEGDHVISTMMEHNSVLRPLYEIEKKGVELTLIKADVTGNIDYKDFEKNIKPNTKAIICTHSSNVTGNMNDISSIGKIAKEHGLLFIVDSAQTAGIVPIDVQEMNIDVLCFTGHKSLLAPQGTGGIYVRPGIDIRPLKSGGSGIMTYHKEHPEVMPTRLEAGTLNSHGLAGLAAAIEYINDTGMKKIRDHELSLMEHFYNGVRDLPGVKIYGDFSDMKNRTPIVSINIGDYDSGAVSDFLFSEYGISIRSGGHCAPLMHECLGTVESGVVRFSFGHSNTMEDVEAAIEAVKEICTE